MKCFFLITSLLISAHLSAQLAGSWKGILQKDGQKIENAQIFYLDFTSDGSFVAITREEYTGKDAFAVKKCKGSIKGKHAEINQFVVQKKKDAAGNKWCNYQLDLMYIDTMGYIQGTYKSAECRGVTGKVFLTKTTEKIGVVENSKELQAWSYVFIDDIKNGRKSAEIRDVERKNFKFIPIYFGYDKSEIKSEYYAFLSNLIRVVKGHSDLRVKVIGFTDADGSDEYNIGLSERRAAAIIQYFVAHGLAADRLEIDFKGEKEPVGDNTTNEGKQLNRRVDFSFI